MSNSKGTKRQRDERGKNSARDEDIERSDNSSQSSGAELYETLNLLESKQPRARTAGITKFTQLLAANTTVEWLADDVGSVCASLLKGLKYAQGEEYIAYLSLLVRISATDTDGTAGNAIVDALPSSFVRGLIMTRHTNTLPYNLTAAAALMLFAPIDDDSIKKCMDAMTTTAFELSPTSHEQSMCHLFYALAALTSLDFHTFDVEWKTEHCRRRLDALLTCNNAKVSKAVGHFILTLFGKDSDYKTFLPRFRELTELYGKDISRDTLKETRSTFTEYVSEFETGVFEEYTIKLKKYDKMDVTSRQLHARYTLLLMALSIFDDLDHIISGNDTVREFLSLPKASLKNIKHKGEYLGVITDEELHRHREHRRQEKLERQKRK